MTEKYIGAYAVMRGQGIVQAAQADYLAVGIFELRRLVEAEVFDDLLEQAEHLLAKNYYQAAAVIAGSVLEDAMRRLCHKHALLLRASLSSTR